MSFSSRRIWVSISDPHPTWRKMLDQLRVSREAWRILLSATSLVYTMLPRPSLECHAAADAMATETVVGVGGYIILPSGISRWYQLQLGPSDFQDIAPWATVPLQRNICAFELPGQCLLLQLTSRLLQGCRQHCTIITACDNASGEVAATKGISSSIGISSKFLQLFRYQLLYDVFQQVRHIPGYLKTTADALNRFEILAFPQTVRFVWIGDHLSFQWHSSPCLEVDVSTSFRAIERV